METTVLTWRPQNILSIGVMGGLIIGLAFLIGQVFQYTKSNQGG